MKRTQTIPEASDDFTRFAINKSRRAGMTLIEILVSISIISALASLIAPGIMSARAAARKTECMNNLRQLSLASENFAATGRTLALEDGTENGSWCRILLPQLDRPDIDRVMTSGTAAEIDAARQLQLKYFTCPLDFNHFEQPGGLSYVANAGYIRNAFWWEPEDVSHRPDEYTEYSPAWPTSKTLATGAVFRATLSGRVPITNYDDGRSTTLLFSENLQAGSWHSRYTGNIAFGVDVTLDRYNGETLELGSSVIVGDDGLNTPSMINTYRDTAAIGQTPRPSSNHAGGVNAAYADGHATFLNDSMSEQVYFRLITSSGTVHGQKLVGDDEY